mgnify:CR=1 FL=1
MMRKGCRQAIPDVLSGTVDLCLATIPNVVPHLKTGGMYGLAITGKSRSSFLPDLPTVAEIG